MTGNHDDAEDLIQETVVEALNSFHCFQPGTRFDRWFLRIMTNNHIDRARRSRRAKILSIDSAVDTHNGEEWNFEIPDHSGNPETSVMDGILDEKIQEGLNRLPEEFRTVVVLSDIEDFSYEEISQIMKCPIGTVRSRLHRGRNMLKRLLQNGMRKEARQQ